jgi:hypothetical protein
MVTDGSRVRTDHYLYAISVGVITNALSIAIDQRVGAMLGTLAARGVASDGWSLPGRLLSIGCAV